MDQLKDCTFKPSLKQKAIISNENMGLSQYDLKLIDDESH